MILGAGPRAGAALRAALVLLVASAGADAARAAGPLRLLDALERARLVSLAPAANSAKAAPASSGARVELSIPAAAPWERVAPDRAKAIGAPADASLWRLELRLPTADVDGVELSRGGAPLPVWRRQGPQRVVPGFLYQPGGFLAPGLYLALPAGEDPRGTGALVRYSPNPADRAQRLAAAGGRPDPRELATVVERAHVARPALLVPAGTALEVPVVPPPGARLAAELAREAPPLAGDTAATTLRLGVVAAGETTWLVERRFVEPPRGDEAWLALDADLSPWAGREVALRLEVAAEGAGAAPLHYLAEPELRGAATTAPPPNLLLLVLDGLRADRLDAARTPNLVRLAGAGLWLQQARTITPWTRPSIASLFTGVPPARHGVASEAPDAALPPDLPTLAGVLRAAGYSTAAFSANLHLDPAFGLVRGFSRARVVHEDGAALRDAVLAHVASPAPEPWFVFAFLMDTHHPFRHRPEFDRSSGIAAPLRSAAELGAGRDRAARGVAEPTPAEVRKLEALYDENVRYVDARVGELLDGLAARGALARTIVVVAADHGEAFGEHGSYFHGHDLHEEVLRVPLLVAGPGVPAGEIRVDPVSLVDLPGTLLAWLGAGAGALPGRDLRRPCAGADGACAQAFETRFRGADQAALLDAPYKLIVDRRAGRKQLFDLARDAGEREDLAAAQPARVRALEAQLRERLAAAASAAPRTPAAAAPGGVDPETAEALRALGYVNE